MPLNSDKAQDRLYDFKLQELFILELGWSQPANRNPESLDVEGQTYQRSQIAQRSGAPIFEITSPNGDIPTAEIRNAIDKLIAVFFDSAIGVYGTAPANR